MIMIRTCLRNAVAALALVATMSAMAQNDRDRDRDVAKQAELQRCSQLIGMNVQTEDGQNCGKVENLALDLQNGRPVYCIMNTSGVSGMNNKLIPVPFKALKFSEGRQSNVRINVNKQRLLEAPEFNSSGWNTIGDTKWGRTVHQHYSVTPDFGDQDIRCVKATECLGMAVNGKQREDIGQVEDLLIDPRTDTIPFAVITLERGKNADKMYLVPWQVVDVRGGGDRTLVLNVERQRITEAPSFERGNWPSLADSRSFDRIYSHYNVQPGSGVYGYSGSGKETLGPGSNTAGGWELNNDYGRKFNTSKMETINGRVTNVDRFTPMSGMSEGIMLRVKDNNQTIDCHLGPAWFIERQQGQFKDGDEVRVNGSRVEVDGKPCIMACEVRRGDHLMILRDREGLPQWDAWRYTSESAREKANEQRDKK